MKRSLAAVTVGFLAVLLSGSPSWSQKNAPPESWSAYRNDAFHFTLDTPIALQPTVATAATAGGPMPNLQATVDLGDGGALQITAMDFTQVKTSTMPDAIMENSVQGAITAGSLVKDYEIPITKGAAFGHEFVAHNGELKFKGRIYYLRGYIVMIAGGGPVAGDIPAAWTRMESSLKFLP